MAGYAEPITSLIKALSRLPGVGEKSATRLALFILNSDRAYVDDLVRSLEGVKDKVALCSSCMAFTDSDPCRICGDAGRDASVVCVVSDFRDMMAIEAAGGFGGRYHILHGCLAPLKGVGPEDLKVKELVRRVEGNGVKEVVIATAFDPEGEATSLYLASVLKKFPVRLTRIASGVPVGGSIEYMDAGTLERAMDGRKEIL